MATDAGFTVASCSTVSNTYMTVSLADREYQAVWQHATACVSGAIKLVEEEWHYFADTRTLQLLPADPSCKTETRGVNNDKKRQQESTTSRADSDNSSRHEQG